MSVSTEPVENKIPELVLRRVLRESWNTANTDGVMPDIHRGWFDDGNDEPELTISDAEDSPVDSGNTGFYAITQDGSPVQLIGGTVRLNIWADRDRLRAANAPSTNADRWTLLAWLETRRILRGAYDGAHSETLTFLSYGGRQNFVEDDRDPTLYRIMVIANFGEGPQTGNR